MFKKTTVIVGGALLFTSSALFPLTSRAYVDCRDTTTGCTVAQLVAISSQTFLSTEDRASALRQAITMLTQQIAQLQSQNQSAPSCFVPAYDLYIGRTDADTNGEVKKLQLWLKSQGYFADAQGTGYYGEKTAEAVMRWQKAHGMDFVNLKSGVGKQTRAKMQEKCSTPSLGSTVQKISWGIVQANPNITNDNDYRKSEQAISVDVTFTDNTTKRYNLGTAYGCSGSTVQSTENGKTVFGRVNCYYALSGVGFVAYAQNGKFMVERGDESAKDGSVKTTVLLEI